ncbi:hypothetical protein L6164_028419 [Bauhinia variegata]|uniref:Uncharacterized protein n=1 Tax=Bauhinia variegata TaxID=167791 RepID=A0ACB9L620_BAUVA|nr:hypothetical protein L6164_028419 [Bauhinia variegata]
MEGVRANVGELSDQIENLNLENGEISRAAKAMIKELGRTFRGELRSLTQDLSDLRKFVKWELHNLKDVERERGICVINTWEQFKAELRKHFVPHNADIEARGKLRMLRQSGSIFDYIKEFTTIMLEIEDLSDKDAFFYFKDGLKDWAKTELYRRNVQTLDAAIGVAKSLVDYSSKNKKPNLGKSRGDKNGQKKGHDLKECHDSRWVGHPVCQQDKVEQQHPVGLLEPLPIAERPWESVSIDFIMALPNSERYGSIIMVVDHFSKYAIFIPAPKNCKVDEAAHLFFKHVVKFWGIPRSIVSDRDPRFTGKFWRELFKLMETDLNFSTSFHPQIDGQTEHINALLELYLRHYVSAHQLDWAKLLDMAQFSYNLQQSESIGKSPL